ncbi:MAG: glycine cleavage system protein H [Deltaproteobacteria bacterium]|nr:glycine cleavage system protein H [Deltaproteobacteria bacterium]
MQATVAIMRSPEGVAPCIWMQAEVVPRKSCQINFDCPSCRFDRIMHGIAEENRRKREAGRIPGGKRGKIVSWKEKLMGLSPSRRPCLHHMKQRIEYKACTNEYRCGSCDFDQYFHDQFSVHAVVKPVDVLNVQGFSVPQGYYFHPGHTWIKVEEGATVRLGVDEFAGRLFGPLDSIEAPLMGKEVQQGRADIRIARGEHRAEIVSPISGVVTAINPILREEGSLASQDPYSEGWIMSVHANRLREDLKGLMINQESADFMAEETDRLYQTIEETTGPLAVDGGNLGEDTAQILSVWLWGIGFALHNSSSHCWLTIP